MDWKELSLQLRFDEHKKFTEVAKEVQRRYFPDDDTTKVYERIRSYIRRIPQQTKGNITYEDKREIKEADIREYYDSLKKTTEAIKKVDGKQLNANIHIDSQKPIGIAFWGDWHFGAMGIDYELHDRDTEIIRNTDGLYYIGMGDYKDNANPNVIASASFETVAPTNLQDKIVEMKIMDTADKALALCRGCHEDFNKRAANIDALDQWCRDASCVNLWHGGIINLALGEEEYRIAARHKYRGDSGVNTTNSQRTFVNEFGHCDVIAFGHKHYCELQHTSRMHEDTIYLRSGTYKLYDEFGQKIGGYEGGYGVPVIIFFPDRHEMLPVRNLETAQIILSQF